jgi:ribosomal-protein-alanine N-acetyltransferase
MKPWGHSKVAVRRAEIADCDSLADIHVSAFRRGWSNVEFEALLLQPGTHALIADYRTALGRRTKAGFILYRIVGAQAEILSVAVLPACRRRGIGKALIDECLRHLYRDGVHDIHLEVEDSNASAIALYRRVEFREISRREGYYRQSRETPGGALVMLRQLRQPAAGGST